MTTVNSPQERAGASQAGLLVSILLRFPEVGSVKFDPQTHVLRFTLLLRGRMSDPAYSALRELVGDSVGALGALQGTEARTLGLDRTTFGGVTAIEFARDVETLSRDEIAMLIALLRDRFSDSLVVETDGLVEEEQLVQEQLIDAALDDLRDMRGQQNLIAYREGGRVLVFNK